jgi:signal transduction histidine kinase
MSERPPSRRSMLGLAFPLRVWLTLSHFAMLALPVVVLVATGALATDLRNQTRADLLHQGQVFATLLAGEFAAGEADLSGLAELSPVLTSVREQNLAGIRIVDRTGRVVATSGDQLGEDLSSRPEVARALAGVVGDVVRPRPPLSSKQSLASDARFANVRVFVAVPIEHGGQTIGAVVLSRTPREEVQALYQMGPRLAWGVVGGLLFAVLPTLLYGHLFSRSLRRVSETANRMAAGSVAESASLDLPDASHVVEARELSAAFRTMAGRLRERLTYFSDFAGNVAHEFKTPLASLKGTIELLEDAEMPDPQRARFLANAAEDVQRLDRVVGGLLLLARAEEGEAQGRLSLESLVRSSASRFEGVLVSGSAGEVFGNADQLAVLVENLLENAVRHGSSPVEVALWRTEEHTGLEVRDAGPGVSEGNADKIFRRFFTTDPGEGTGLGLALVRAIARVHGGEVMLTRRASPTTFRLRLPRR